ncbi:MAG: hypothetical protein B6D58_01480 [candidate division Zixibacteria bacterium 4484_95]|nr:MAG: hypothetical protein B6D58_01480 [candidate division Zixibacteria bacterium 4484_95]
MEEKKENLIGFIESTSERIQILALNIAVVAAKMSYNKELGLDVNNKLNQLVNQVTLAVKNIGHILRAAKTNKMKNDVFTEGYNVRVNPELVNDIEIGLNKIMEDSQKIMEMLNKVKQKSLDGSGG